MKYCEPNEAGISSQARQVGTKIAHLLDKLDYINSNRMRGKIVHDCAQFQTIIMGSLRKEGWRITARGNKWQVLPPK